MVSGMWPFGLFGCGARRRGHFFNSRGGGGRGGDKARGGFRKGRARWVGKPFPTVLGAWGGGQKKKKNKAVTGRGIVAPGGGGKVAVGADRRGCRGGPQTGGGRGRQKPGPAEKKGGPQVRPPHHKTQAPRGMFLGLVGGRVLPRHFPGGDPKRGVLGRRAGGSRLSFAGEFFFFVFIWGGKKKGGGGHAPGPHPGGGPEFPVSGATGGTGNFWAPPEDLGAPKKNELRGWRNPGGGGGALLIASGLGNPKGDKERNGGGGRRGGQKGSKGWGGPNKASSTPYDGLLSVIP